MPVTHGSDASVAHLVREVSALQISPLIAVPLCSPT